MTRLIETLDDVKRNSIELIVFDMDGVLAHLNYAKRLATLAQFTGKNPAFIHRTIYASDFERAAEAGAYPSGSSYLAEFNRLTESALTREQWIAARKGSMTPSKETFAIAHQLKGRVPIATLTNNGALLKEAIAEILPEAAEVFGNSFHASFEFGARKPDRDVFNRLARHYSIDNERILFIDDTADYIEGAKSARLNTILFSKHSSLGSQLAEFGIRVCFDPAPGDGEAP